MKLVVEARREARSEEIPQQQCAMRIGMHLRASDQHVMQHFGSAICKKKLEQQGGKGYNYSVCERVREGVGRTDTRGPVDLVNSREIAVQMAGCKSSPP